MNVRDLESALWLSSHGVGHVFQVGKFVFFYETWKTTRRSLSADQATLRPVISGNTTWGESAARWFDEPSERAYYSAFLLLHAYALVSLARLGRLPSPTELDRISVRSAARAILASFAARESNLDLWKTWLGNAWQRMTDEETQPVQATFQW